MKNTIVLSLVLVSILLAGPGAHVASADPGPVYAQPDFNQRDLDGLGTASPFAAGEVSGDGPEISNFNITPIYHSVTGQIISAKIEYQIDELERLTPEAELILRVFHEGRLLEKLTLLSLSQLQPDINTGSLGYIPSEGWKPGVYIFQVELREQEGFVGSPKQYQFGVEPESVAKVVSWQTLGIVIGVGVILMIVIVTFVLYRWRYLLKE